jgi:hypothetical protein
MRAADCAGSGKLYDRNTECAQLGQDRPSWADNCTSALTPFASIATIFDRVAMGAINDKSALRQIHHRKIACLPIASQVVPDSPFSCAARFSPVLGSMSSGRRRPRDGGR